MLAHAGRDQARPDGSCLSPTVPSPNPKFLVLLLCFCFFFPKLCAKILFGLCYTGSIWVNSQTDFRKVIILVCLSTLLQAGFPLTDVLAVRIKISKTGSEINLPSLADSVLDRGWFICNYLMMFLNWQF